MEKTLIKVNEYGVRAENKDNTLALRLLLDGLRDKADVVLRFEKGEYHFKPDFAYEKLLYISNHHEDTIKRIIFDLSGFENLTIEGDGSSFIFYTDCIPFYVHRGKGLLFRDFTMDYNRPAYSEGIIRRSGAREMVVSIDHKKYPHKVEHGRLYFYGDNVRNQLWGWLEFDGIRKAPVEQGLDVYVNVNSWDATVTCRELNQDEVVFEKVDGRDFLPIGREGNFLVLRHHQRTDPGFYMTCCEEIGIDHVTCYHALGIGFMAEHSRNITLDHFEVCMNPENQRIFTASADATHFVYCCGIIELKNCLFENQLDDAANIHGIYARVGKVISDHEFLVYLVESMHKGVIMAEKGDSIALLESDTLCKAGEGIVEETVFLNKDYQYIRTGEPITGLKEGMVIENLQWIPDIWIHDCIFRNNRARGLLLTSAGKILVENNLFQNAGAAVLLEGDAGGWFESGETRDIVLRNNTFDNCSYVADWGLAPIQSTPSVVKKEGYPYHKSVQILDNAFILFDERVLYMRHVKKLVFTGNTIEKSSKFQPRQGLWADCFDVEEFIQGEEA